MKVFKSFALALTAGVLSLSFFACNKAASSASDGGNKKSVTVSLVIPTSQVNFGGTKDCIARWEQKTGNKIDLQAIQDEQYDNLVKARLAGGSDLDIFLGAFSKYAVPDVMLEVSPESFASRLNPIALDSLRYSDGKYYGYPKPDPIESYGVFYNTKVFDELGLKPPKTLAEFDTLCAAIKAKGIVPIYFAAKDGWTMLQHRNAVNGTMYASSPKDIWDQLNKNQVRFENIPSMVDQYKAVESWVKKGYINKDLATATYDESKENIATGKAAMVIQGTWFESEVRLKFKDAPLGAFPLPSVDGNNYVAIGGFDGGFHIAKNSKVAEAAKDFLSFRIQPEEVRKALEISPGISAYKDVDSSDILGPAIRELQETIVSGKVAPHGDVAYLVPMPYDELVALYQELLMGKIGAESFLKQESAAYIRSAKLAKLSGF